MSMKRGRRAVSASLEPENERPAWQVFCAEDTLVQWHKLKNVESLVLRARERIGEDLFKTWSYHVVISWFYKVCDSFVTANYAGDIETFKPFWKDVKFDEELLLQELSGLAGELTLWESLRWHTLKNVANSKGVSLKDWNELAQHYLKDRGDYKFEKLTLEEQFQEVYAMIRVIERKNLPFRNYLLANLELFESVAYEDDDTGPLYALANVGVLVRKLVKQSPHEIHIPLKLKNCTVRLPHGPNGFELVHLDYSAEINRYLQSVKVDYELVTHNWEQFAQCVESNQIGEPSPNVDYEDLVNVYVEHQLYSRRLLQQRQKDHDMAELLTRRKRSSRLVAREEEVRRKDLESEWLDRLDSRDQFLRARSRLVNRNVKKIKDWLWSQLWSNFEKDLRITRGDPISKEEGSELTADDLKVLAQGTRYVDWICPVTETAAAVSTTGTDEHPLELPLHCCVTEEDVERGAAQEVDDQRWIFKCVGEPDLDSIWIGSPEEEQEHAALFAEKGGSLVCCESCLRWQHWECQSQRLLLLLASSQGRDSPVTARDFGIVQLGHASVQASRRSSRRAAMSNDQTTTNSADYNVEQHYLRPTDKRKPLGETGVFICAWCCYELEKQLRETFPAELSALRAKQRKNREERERRRLAAVNAASRTPVNGTFSAAATPAPLPTTESSATPTMFSAFNSSFATNPQQTPNNINSSTTNGAAQLSDSTASATPSGSTTPAIQRPNETGQTFQ
ncbi:hypothetical protein ZYGR_0N02810 [Zygosaccharomyces rouxii]|uniref:ZYRO0D06798p n=2 Tax=Zygosaccharomyces rouxii TaxID=4956 RepID=C5DVH6_ZYGRC|nr:uncharacterized protein ZYRO0D06798g [Zygosaccharomyces rouxii]KAH9200708.1 hypothetical protein LQ764DRAFT_233950 [Zygosaccharomyces rouxii]GAV48876.1 hypothetical protein ZYGR_0N02810 [Zygosaccharomyces rouxii]CAR27795.1 ZYRO0D06798p [Zygosaccharomyces rouxii]